MKRINIRKVLVVAWPFIAAFLVFCCIRLAVNHGQYVETWYSERLYPIISVVLSTISRLIAVSLWDIFWMIIIILVMSGLLLVIFGRIKPGWYLLKIGQATSIIYVVFYISWGFNYFRPGIETRIGMETVKRNEKMFRSVLDTVIEEANRNFVVVKTSSYSEINNLVELSYRDNSKELGIKYPNGHRRTKTMLFSTLLIKFGISGYFGPFFNEVHLNHYILPSDYPFTLAHEKAHQFGMASEAEANLAAFIVCTTSEDKKLRYSAYRNILLYFLSDASVLKDYPEYVKKIDKRVMTDLRFRGNYYRRLRNKTLEKLQSIVYNIFLKSNHVSKGVLSYNQVVGLVIDWYNYSESESHKK
jgi:hypothetical protein